MMESSKSVACPGCGSVFEQRRYGDLEIDECRDCGGLWFDSQELADYLMRRKVASTGVDWAGPCRDIKTSSMRLSCPRCEDSQLKPCKWGVLVFNRCGRCFGAHVGRADLENYIADVGQSEGIGGGEAFAAAVGSVAGIVARFFVHGREGT